MQCRNSFPGHGGFATCADTGFLRGFRQGRPSKTHAHERVRHLKRAHGVSNPHLPKHGLHTHGPRLAMSRQSVDARWKLTWEAFQAGRSPGYRAALLISVRGGGGQSNGRCQQRIPTAHRTTKGVGPTMPPGRRSPLRTRPRTLCDRQPGSCESPACQCRTPGCPPCCLGFQSFEHTLPPIPQSKYALKHQPEP